MKVMIVTTPIRPVPTGFPPFGSLALIKYLRKNGIDDVEFYNIDGNRPSYDEVLAHIRERKPDVFGISAVVSTAYEYTKRLALDVKAVSPETMIVLGGNLGASANVLLTRAGIDLVALGESERILVNVVNRAHETRTPSEFKDIPGLALLDTDGTLVNTGYEAQLPGEDLYDIDWDDLAQSSNMDLFFPIIDSDGAGLDHLKRDKRYMEPARRGKKVATLYTAKGCVSRCTFCHRWDKGIRFIPAEVLRPRIEELVTRFNVGFLRIADENFGTNKRWLDTFCETVKEFDLLWGCGTRVKGVTEEQIDMMRDSGCVSILYGNESGSARMLEVMEKKVNLQSNYDALQWTVERGLDSVVPLVVGMPGESPETVAETIEFCKFATTVDPVQRPTDMSVNYAQALPGTPLYEFARRRAMIGPGIDGEEEYLLAISDRDAHDEYTTLNFTDYPKLMCETWRPRITVEVNYNYLQKFGQDHYRRQFFGEGGPFDAPGHDSGYYANPKRLMETGGESQSPQDTDAASRPASLFHLIRTGHWGLALIFHPVAAYHARSLLLFMVIAKNLREYGTKHSWAMVREYLAFRLTTVLHRRKFEHGYKTLRKIVERDIGAMPGDDPALEALRRGR